MNVFLYVKMLESIVIYADNQKSDIKFLIIIRKYVAVTL